MVFTVYLTRDARKDLLEIYDYILSHDGSRKATYVLSKIEKALETLSAFPERGARPDELLQLGIREYRQIFFKPYRILYRTVGPGVYVMLIADGRRNMQALLEQRFLRA